MSQRPPCLPCLVFGAVTRRPLQLLPEFASVLPWCVYVSAQQTAQTIPTWRTTSCYPWTSEEGPSAAGTEDPGQNARACLGPRMKWFWRKRKEKKVGDVKFEHCHSGQTPGGFCTARTRLRLLQRRPGAMIKEKNKKTHTNILGRNMVL